MAPIIERSVDTHLQVITHFNRTERSWRQSMYQKQNNM